MISLISAHRMVVPLGYCVARLGAGRQPVGVRKDEERMRRRQHLLNQLRMVTVAALAAIIGIAGMQGAYVGAQADDSPVVCYVNVPGPQGPQGEQGDAGPQGQQGPNGEDGAPGKDGKDGLPGPQGPQGPAGPQGPPGGIVNSFGGTNITAILVTTTIKGNTAYQVVDPYASEYVDHVSECSPNSTSIICVGVEGPPGLPGPHGVEGAPGPQGSDGVDGADGESGKPGAPGEQGPPGEPGYLSGASPSQAEIAPLTVNGFAQTDNDPWSAHGCYAEGVERIGEPTQGPQGPIGPKGPEGVQGNAGAPGQSGENGKDGLSGAPGPAGEPGQVGPQGPTLAIPVVPVIGVAVCEDNEVVLPDFTITDDRDGITYGTPVIGGGTVTVTATLTVDATWSVSELPEGWSTTDDPLVIIFEGEYTEVPCETETPPTGTETPPAGTETPPAETEVPPAETETPVSTEPTSVGTKTSDATEIPTSTTTGDSEKTVVTTLPDTGTGTGIGTFGTGTILASMAGLMLMVVAIRVNATKRS